MFRLTFMLTFRLMFMLMFSSLWTPGVKDKGRDVRAAETSRCCSVPSALPGHQTDLHLSMGGGGGPVPFGFWLQARWM